MCICVYLYADVCMIISNYIFAARQRKRKESAHWVQNIKHSPKVSFSINDNVFKGTARIVDQDKESALAAEVSKLMNTKYKWSQGLIVELTPMNST
jgi:hypothetical protein